MNNKNISITREEIQAVLPQVIDIIADAIACDADKVRPDASLIDDLGAESIDFVDIVFRLQRQFKVKIPRGQIIEDARGDLSEADFEKGGVVTDAGVARLREFMSEVPADRFKSPLKVSDIPRLFTVETFCKLIIRQQRAGSAGSAGPAA